MKIKKNSPLLMQLYEIEKALANDDLINFESLVQNNNNIGSAMYSITIQKQGTLPNDHLTLLHVAAYYNALDCFRYLQLTRNIPLRKESAGSFYSLHYSCLSGSSEVSLYILSQDPDEATHIVQGGDRQQVIYCSIVGGNPEILEALFKVGASLSKYIDDQNDYIKKAISLHNAEILKLLYKHYQKNDKQSNKFIPLSMKAAKYHDIEAFRLLYRGPEDIIFKLSDGTYENLVEIICSFDKTYTFKKDLLKILDDCQDLDLEPPKNSKEGLAHLVCSYMDVSVAEKIINLPCFNPNRLDENKKSAMYRLISKNEPDASKIMQMLINKGLDINVHPENEASILESFVLFITKDLLMIDCLLKNGANMDEVCVRTFAKGKTIYECVMSMRSNKINDQIKEIFNKYRHKKEDS